MCLDVLTRLMGELQHQIIRTVAPLCLLFISVSPAVCHSFFNNRCRQGTTFLNNCYCLLEFIVAFSFSLSLCLSACLQWRTSAHFMITRARPTRSSPFLRGRWSACWAATLRRTTDSGRGSWTDGWESSPPCWWKTWPRTGKAAEEGRATSRCVGASWLWCCPAHISEWINDSSNHLTKTAAVFDRDRERLELKAKSAAATS